MQLHVIGGAWRVGDKLKAHKTRIVMTKTNRITSTETKRIRNKTETKSSSKNVLPFFGTRRAYLFDSLETLNMVWSWVTNIDGKI